MHDFAFVFAGFLVGLVVGLTGVGGGSLMTPLRTAGRCRSPGTLIAL